jgi:hypothetical protein
MFNVNGNIAAEHSARLLRRKIDSRSLRAFLTASKRRSLNFRVFAEFQRHTL